MKFSRNWFFVLVCVMAFSGLVSAQAQERPLILVSNDDGIDSEGILALVRALESFADIVVCAPMKNHSGIGHGLTVEGPIRVNEIKREGKVFGHGIEATPATCVMLGLDKIVTKRPDIVVSGINEGGNLGTTVLVSGTFNAAQEAVMNGIPAVAVSLERTKGMEYTPAADFTAALVKALMKKGFPKNAVVNVNVPGAKMIDLAGWKLTRLSDFRYRQIWHERKTPWGQPYYWSTIRKPLAAFSVETDAGAVDANLISVSIVPLIGDSKAAMRPFADLQIETPLPKK